MEYSGGEREGMVKFGIGRLIDWRGETGGVEEKKEEKEGDVEEWRGGRGGISTSNMIDNSTLFIFSPLEYSIYNKLKILFGWKNHFCCAGIVHYLYRVLLSSL